MQAPAHLSVALSEQIMAALEELRPTDAGNPFAWLSNRPTSPVPISEAERVQGLAAFWAEARASYAYWHLVPDLDWDAAFREYLPRAVAAEAAAEYYRLLVEFAALLKDGHTYVIAPPWVEASEAAPRLRLYPVDGEPVVLEGDALPAGTAILAADGRPVGGLLMEFKVPASTQHDRLSRFCSTLLTGPKGSSVQAEVRLPGGEVRSVTLERNGPLPTPPPFERVDLGEGRVLVRLNTFMDATVAEQFHTAFPDFDGVKALVLDLRQNRGGNTGYALQILARLIDQPVPTLLGRMPMYCGVTTAWALPRPWLSVPEEPLLPDTHRPRYGGPVAVLTSFVTYSAAENMCAVFRNSRRGPLVGDPTGGSTGQPVIFRLPGGGFGAVCTKQTTYPDGTPLVGVGVVPDIPVAPTARALAEGRDLVLERALEALGCI